MSTLNYADDEARPAISTRFDASTLHAVDAIARCDGRTRSSVLRRLVVIALTSQAVITATTAIR